MVGKVFEGKADIDKTSDDTTKIFSVNIIDNNIESFFISEFGR